MSRFGQFDQTASLKSSKPIFGQLEFEQVDRLTKCDLIYRHSYRTQAGGFCQQVQSDIIKKIYFNYISSKLFQFFHLHLLRLILLRQTLVLTFFLVWPIYNYLFYPSKSYLCFHSMALRIISNKHWIDCYFPKLDNILKKN